jgi:hypothetical protein
MVRDKASLNTSVSADLGRLAEAIDPDQPGTKQQPLSDEELRTVARYLRRLARTPKALEALTGDDGRRRAPRRAEARNWNIALDYMLAFMRLGSARAARGEVELAWGLERSRLLEICRACNDRPEWVRWASDFIGFCANAHPLKPGPELLLEISKELRASEKPAQEG